MMKNVHEQNLDVDFYFILPEISVCLLKGLPCKLLTLTFIYKKFSNFLQLHFLSDYKRKK